MRRRWVQAVGLTTAIVIAVLVAAIRSVPEPIEPVRRIPRLVAQSQYAEEMRCLFLCGWETEPRASETYTDSGHLVRRSGDGAWVAVTVDSCSEGVSGIVGRLLGSQSCYVHNIEIRSASGAVRRPVLTVFDQEPGSGSGHRYRWSEDSKALLVFGGAGLVNQPTQPVDLCFVYEVSSDDLLRLNECPVNRSAPMKDMIACRQSRRCI